MSCRDQSIDVIVHLEACIWNIKSIAKFIDHLLIAACENIHIGIRCYISQGLRGHNEVAPFIDSTQRFENFVAHFNGIQRPCQYCITAMGWFSYGLIEM